ARAVRADGLEFLGWIANALDPGFERAEANLATLETRLEAPLLGRLAHHPEARPKELAMALAGAAARF
ncbi:MAG TPA: dethiobiotin synthase, partial [Gammaproteobacteria bacterium]|nr:dethiobiotin synthase [Gammaproteobacteria bacterium]